MKSLSPGGSSNLSSGMISSAGLFQTDLGTHDFQGQIVIQVEFRQNLSLSISGTLFFVVVFLSNSSLTILKSAFCFHPRKTVSFLQVFQLTFKHSVQFALRLDVIKWGNHALPFPSSKCLPLWNLPGFIHSLVPSDCSFTCFALLFGIQSCFLSESQIQ